VGKRPRPLAALPVAAVLVAAGCTGVSRHEAAVANAATAPTVTTPTAASTASSTSHAVAAPATTVATTGTTTPAPTMTVAEAVQSFEADRGYETAPVPVAVEIPAISVVSDLEELHRNADGTIQVPAWHRAGWWADGPKPGQLGPAVILGHVDNQDGADVFYRLNELRAGDAVVVTRADGSTVRFGVERVERHPKHAFPTDDVYAPSLEPGLRLVTCGGEFDRASGHYRDNIIAFATLIP
jgi:sortase (surface protein transpeptidase)